MQLISVLGVLLAATGSTNTARLRARTPTPTPSHTPTPRPSPTSCRYPAVSPPLASGTCPPGTVKYALQVQDCNSPSNGQYAKVGISPSDGVARLWTSLACGAFSGTANCTEPLLAAEPTMFNWDRDDGVSIAEGSPLPANGGGLAGQRMEFDAAGNTTTAGASYISDIRFAVPGSAAEKSGQLKPLICPFENSGNFTCMVGSGFARNAIGIVAKKGGGVEGMEVMVGLPGDWRGACRGSGRCGVTRLRSVEAC